MSVRQAIQDVTDRIAARSRETRRDYLGRIEAARENGVHRAALSCGNLAHGFAACSPSEKAALAGNKTLNLGIITSYNDMLSAHQPYQFYPEIIKEAAREIGSTAQVAGGVPAMCDGVTQGMPGMDLSLFSRDVIAMATAISLSHNMFDAAVYLGICDKIVPGLMIGALTFGHLPAVFIPAGPMPSGMPNDEKSKIRQLYSILLDDFAFVIAQNWERQHVFFRKPHVRKRVVYAYRDNLSLQTNQIRHRISKRTHLFGAG